MERCSGKSCSIRCNQPILTMLAASLKISRAAIHLRSLSFAEINDLLHDRGSHLAHHRPHSRKEIHERSEQPTGSWHNHDLCLITPDALQDRFSYCFWWRQEGFVHGRQVQVHLLHRPCPRSSAADTAEDEQRTAEVSCAVIGAQHAVQADK